MSLFEYKNKQTNDCVVNFSKDFLGSLLCWSPELLPDCVRCHARNVTAKTDIQHTAVSRTARGGGGGGFSL